MKRILFGALALAWTLTASPAVAQLAPYNEAGLTMGHWHIATKDVEAEKKLFLAMGGKLYNPGGQPLIAFPGVYISLILAGETGEGGTVGSVVNHVGFSPLETIKCATKTGAEIMGCGDELGKLAPGKLADVLVVDGDVVQDISLLEDRRRFIAVMQGGAIKAGQLARSIPTMVKREK